MESLTVFIGVLWSRQINTLWRKVFTFVPLVLIMSFPCVTTLTITLLTHWHTDELSH